MYTTGVCFEMAGVNRCSAQAIKLTSSEEDLHEKVHFPVLIKDYGGTYIKIIIMTIRLVTD